MGENLNYNSKNIVHKPKKEMSTENNILSSKKQVPIINKFGSLLKAFFLLKEAITLTLRMKYK